MKRKNLTRGYLLMATEKEVRFDIYCPKCEHWEEDEDGDHCWYCLDCPTNYHSEKPVKYEEKYNGTK